MKTFHEYQAELAPLAFTPPRPVEEIPCCALGIAGEAGEVADLLKKHLYHGHQLDLDKLKKELGDVLWYVQRLSTLYGFTLEDVAAGNVAKLQARYANGFSREASIARKS